MSDPDRHAAGEDHVPRRLRTNARTVKRAISKHNARGPNIDRRTYQATITATILAGPS